MNSSIECLKELSKLVDKLKSLLDNPEPGLVSWCQAYSKTMIAISDFWKLSNFTLT